MSVISNNIDVEALHQTHNRAAKQTEWEPGGEACITPHGANMSKKQNASCSCLGGFVIKRLIIDILFHVCFSFHSLAHEI